MVVPQIRRGGCLLGMCLLLRFSKELRISSGALQRANDGRQVGFGGGRSKKGAYPNRLSPLFHLVPHFKLGIQQPNTLQLPLRLPQACPTHVNWISPMMGVDLAHFPQFSLWRPQQFGGLAECVHDGRTHQSPKAAALDASVPCQERHLRVNSASSPCHHPQHVVKKKASNPHLQ